jgi:hypothetical protein
METVNPFVFQTDSQLVNDIYQNNPNYRIEYLDSLPNQICVIYFSSNDIYYPNTDKSFIYNIKEKDKYEWYGTRIPNAYKHIFLRDIKKQWYLSGINKDIYTPQMLLAFLQKETLGYSVILVGSSAGGFASVLYGSLLNAIKVYTFNGQFEINSLLKTSTPDIDPLIFRYASDENLRPFYDTKPFINNHTKIFYFHSSKSQWDMEQLDHMKDTGIHLISFITNHHGIPFLKCNIPPIFSLDSEKLLKLKNKKHHPLFFSIQQVGLIETVRGLYLQISNKLKKKLIHF